MNLRQSNNESELRKRKRGILYVIKAWRGYKNHELWELVATSRLLIDLNEALDFLERLDWAQAARAGSQTRQTKWSQWQIKLEEAAQRWARTNEDSHAREDIFTEHAAQSIITSTPQKKKESSRGQEPESRKTPWDNPAWRARTLFGGWL